MHIFQMIVWIVAIGIIGGVLMRYFEYKAAKNTGNFDDYIHKKDFVAMVKKIDILEERVRNLERIATDKGINLALEIDKLT